MRTTRSLLVGTVLGLGLAVVALAPAHASSEASTVEYAASANATPVTGQPWSAPAYPVDCLQSGDQITCTPQSASDAKAQQCFTRVYVAGGRATVCTTYEGHVAAIKTSGGTPLLVEYGCSLGDLVCTTFENAGRGMALSATGMMFAISQNMRFDTSSLLWTAAVQEWSFWQWAILVITFGAMVWAITAAAVSGDRAELVGALIRSFIAVAAVPISLWIAGHLVNAIDEMTWYIMNRDGQHAVFATLQGVMWAGGQANYFFAFIIHGLLMLGMLLLMLVFAFRNIVLAALIAVGPVAWMLFPVRGIGPQWIVRYASAVVVLLLTGPLTIGFVALIINGLSTVHTIWDPQSWPMLIGLVLVAFAPFAVFGLFSFVGAVAADSVGSGVGTRAARGAGNAARSASRIPSRLNAHPAGGTPIFSGSSRSVDPKSGGSRPKTSGQPTRAAANSAPQEPRRALGNPAAKSTPGANAPSSTEPRTPSRTERTPS
ncbi:hypothetical protein ASF40_20330 [Microbacterium sp. Leaf288]|uniref:hypothetical protein n=1 Tax=Microbacterium sp. Leaf288 TaxID=1736323 RepID=UPI0006FF7477|nr:hypothetical protein [Microbacterium sp. Leaf288]KQP67713.1 hypothetical protein ASF40_20330 [Microbacterium sp. Leaf288]